MAIPQGGTAITSKVGSRRVAGSCEIQGVLSWLLSTVMKLRVVQSQVHVVSCVPPSPVLSDCPSSCLPAYRSSGWPGLVFLFRYRVTACLLFCTLLCSPPYKDGCLPGCSYLLPSPSALHRLPRPSSIGCLLTYRSSCNCKAPKCICVRPGKSPTVRFPTASLTSFHVATPHLSLAQSRTEGVPKQQETRARSRLRVLYCTWPPASQPIELSPHQITRPVAVLCALRE